MAEPHWVMAPNPRLRAVGGTVMGRPGHRAERRIRSGPRPSIQSHFVTGLAGFMQFLSNASGQI
jgi:hypothetical protein